MPAIDHVARGLARSSCRRPCARAAASRSSARAARGSRSSGSGRCARRAGPVRSDVVTAPSISGVSTTPDDVADVPITPCTKSGTYEIVPNIAMPTSAMQATLPATIGLRRISNGRIGSRARRSTTANDGEQRPPRRRARRRTCALVHGYCLPPQTSPSRSAPVPAASTPAPSQSIECSVCGARRGIVIEITTSATPPTGRLTRKIQRQLALSTMKPPTAGPMIDDAAKTAPISPCQRPRSRGGTMLPITASESGKRPPAPIPCTARKTTSCVIVCRERRRAPSRAGRRRSRRGRGSCGP